MSDPLQPRGQGPALPRSDERPHPEVDWAAIEREPEFQELVRSRRSFVVPATVFFLAWYMGFIVLTAVAPDFMGERIYQGLTVGYTLALTQFLMVLVLGIWYLRKSDREFDPLARRVIERYGGDGGAPTAAPMRHARFHRGTRTSTTPEARS
jgi:uncharacterized membrane protein (DUF485 family)